jgi:hypothetical protein
MKTKTVTHAEGFICRREVLLDGSKKEMYFAQIDRPSLDYTQLRDTIEAAKADGRAMCDRLGVTVPCFYA